MPDGLVLMTDLCHLPMEYTFILACCSILVQESNMPDHQASVPRRKLQAPSAVGRPQDVTAGRTSTQIDLRWLGGKPEALFQVFRYTQAVEKMVEGSRQSINKCSHQLRHLQRICKSCCTCGQSLTLPATGLDRCWLKLAAAEVRRSAILLLCKQNPHA